MKVGMEAVSLFFLVACAFVPAAGQSDTEIGGQKVVTLTRKPSGAAHPEFTSVTLLPGRGMELLQITANFPGKGEVNVLASPDEKTAKQMLDEQDDDFGDLGYRLGSAFLVPYPNRIVGKLSDDHKSVTFDWKGKSMTLPANNKGATPADQHAMHGLILKAKTENLKVTNIPGGQQVTGVIHAGDFGGRWFSKTDLDVTIKMTADAVDAIVTARNVGKEAEPIAIGWHPYFNLPSGDRTQVRVHIPGEELALVNNYESVFPTGEIKPVTGTKFDLRAPEGKPLAQNFYDDNWSKIDWTSGAATVKVIDPAAHYGVAIEGLSPEIKTIQMYAPPTKQFVAIEHQYNFGDPFGSEWKGKDTGMVTLQPGQSTKWHVRIKVFIPKS